MEYRVNEAVGVNNLPKVVTQQRRGRASNQRLLDRKSDALPLSHRATPNHSRFSTPNGMAKYSNVEKMPFLWSISSAITIDALLHL